ncbi:MAG: VanW family protein [Gordonibacter sp.]|uniref:VanW family protein n=1 Tax=Gordonibacter sp. TaxID=1968902 RepID=UPI00321FAD37
MADRMPGNDGGAHRSRTSPQARPSVNGGRRVRSAADVPPATQKPASRPSKPASSTPASKPGARPARRQAQAVPKSRTSRAASAPVQGASYNTPSLWTKNAAPGTSEKNLFQRILSVVGRVLLSLLALVGHGIAWVGRAIVSLVSRSRAALVVTVLVAALVAGGLVDLGMNWGRAYAGVRIGEIDVSGKSAQDMRALVEQTYGPRLAAGSATIYASDDAAAKVADELARAQDVATAEQQSVEQAQANKQLWTASADSLSATLPIDEMVDEAMAVGREQGGLFGRVGALLTGQVVEVRAAYGDAPLESLASDIDATLGNPRVDFDIVVHGGVAEVSDGYDGNMVERDKLTRELDRALLDDAQGKGSFVARVEYAPLRIDHAAAQAVCDQVNSAIAPGARFTYAGSFWDASSTDLGEWVKTSVEKRDEGWSLIPSLDEERAKPVVLAHVQQGASNEELKVLFERKGDDVQVHTDTSHTIPLIAETMSTLNRVLFDASDGAPSEVPPRPSSASAVRPAEGQPVEVAVGSGPAPATTSFDEALSLGIISPISSYTTEYTKKAGTENRNHNIHLASDLLNNSIVKSDGIWSFNGTTGNCNAEKGFLGAGAIINGEYDDAIGGGICQVATTVFNAVYDSGFPVVERHNHSLHMSSYPDGRDAAVSWGELDFQWKNDSTSDVLVRLSYTDTSVTVVLYGINPGYRVKTEVGQWAEGAKYKTKVEYDESMAAGTSYVKTAGADGSSITVVRTVTSATGETLRQDVFDSNYSPLGEVVVAAPGVEVKPHNAAS